MATQSAPFAALAELQGVRGISVGPWSGQVAPATVPATGSGQVTQ